MSKERLIRWLEERRDNCLRLAQDKVGEDRLGWIEDANYFDQAIKCAEQYRGDRE